MIEVQGLELPVTLAGPATLTILSHSLPCHTLNLTVPSIKGACVGKQLTHCACATLRTSVKPFDTGSCLSSFSASLVTDFVAEAEKESAGFWKPVLKEQVLSLVFENTGLESFPWQQN